MPTTEYTPTVNELGLFLKSRTKTRFNAVVGTFTDATPVTAEEAQELIAQAVDEVAIAVGSNLPNGPDDDPDLFRRGAKSLTILLSAMNVESALVQEQVTDPRSAYAAFERRYNNFRKALIEAVTEARGASGGGESDTGVDAAAAFGVAGSFPEPMTRLDERF